MVALATTGGLSLAVAWATTDEAPGSERPVLAAVDPPPVRSTTSPDVAIADGADCAGCLPGSDLVGLTVTGDGGAIQVVVALRDWQPGTGTELFVWSDGGSLVARLLDAGDDWRVEEGEASASSDGSVVTIDVRATVAAIAVSTAGGDRAPDVGHVAPTAAGGEPRVAAGTGAATIEAAVADAEAGFGRLDPYQREVVASLLARQLREQTLTYFTTSRLVEGEATVVISTRYPEISQVSTDRTGAQAGIYVAADGVVACRGRPGALQCEPATTTGVPATAAAAMVASPDAVRVTPLPDGEWRGESTRCMAITSALDDGPTSGRSCWLVDGTLTEADRHNGIVTTLLERTDGVDPVQLAPPQ